MGLRKKVTPQSRQLIKWVFLCNLYIILISVQILFQAHEDILSNKWERLSEVCVFDMTLSLPYNSEAVPNKSMVCRKSAAHGVYSVVAAFTIFL